MPRGWLMPKAEVAVMDTLDTQTLKRVDRQVRQVRTHATERIGKRLGRASAGELAQVLEGVNEILGA